MFGDLSVMEIVKLLAPVIAIQVGIMVFALFKLAKDRVRYLPKWGWALVIIFVNLIGPIVYFTIGRERD